MQGSKCRTENAGTVRRVAAGGRTAVAAGRIDNPTMTTDKEVLFPGESKQTGPAPACTPQILSHSAFLSSAADCRGSVAGASSDVSSDVSGGASRQISQRPFKASGNRKRQIAILRIIRRLFLPGRGAGLHDALPEVLLVRAIADVLADVPRLQLEHSLGGEGLSVGLGIVHGDVQAQGVVIETLVAFDHVQ